MWFMQLQPWGAQSISQRCLSAQSEQSRHNTMSDWAAVKRRCQSLKVQSRSSVTCSQEDHSRQGCIWWDAEWQEESIGTKISWIWTFKTDKTAKMFKTDKTAKTFKTDKTAKMLDHSGWPFDCSGERRTIERRTIGHREMSQVSKWPAWWDEFIGTRISSLWTFKMWRMAKMFNHSAWPFDFSTPPFKGELLVIEKWARYQNNQHNELSSLVPRSAPYEC